MQIPPLKQNELHGFYLQAKPFLDKISNVLSRSGVIIILTMVGLYFIGNFVSYAFYFGYCSGFVSCIVFECIFFWKFLAYKLQSQLSRSKSIIDIGILLNINLCKKKVFTDRKDCGCGCTRIR
jgi:hypothetical protein